MTSTEKLMIWLVVALGGCSTTGGGVPYHLPTSMMTIKLDMLRDKNKVLTDVRVNLAPKLVADNKHLYYLNSKYHGLFRSDHHIVIKNGLLTSVNTIDDGKFGDVVLSGVNSGINVFKAGQITTFAQAASESVFLNDSKVPTSGEVSFALNLIHGDNLTYVYPPNKSIKRPLPGTNGLLFLVSRTDLVSDAHNTAVQGGHLNACSNIEGDQKRWASGGDDTAIMKPFPGVYTRGLAPAETELVLCIDNDKLKERRVAAINEAIVEEADAGKKTTKTKSEQNTKEKAACEKANAKDIKPFRSNIANRIDTLSRLKLDNISSSQLNNINSRISDLKLEDQRLKEALSKCEAAKQNAKSADASDKGSEKKLKKYCKLKSKYEVVSSDSKLEGEIASKTHCDFLNNPAGGPDKTILTEHTPIKQNKEIVMLTDSRILKVPLRRAWLGKTTNTLEFSDGILTEFHTKQPSPAVVMAGSVFEVTKSLVSLPAELVQLRINLTGQHKELATKQVELKDELDRLSGTVARQTEITNQINLLKVQNELRVTRAELQAKIDNLDIIGVKAGIISERKVIAEQNLLTDARIAAEAAIDRLEGTEGQIGDIKSQLTLAEQQALLRTAQSDTQQQITDLVSQTELAEQQGLFRAAQADSPEIAELKRQVAEREQMKKLLQLRKEIEQLDIDIRKLNNPEDGSDNGSGE